MAGFNLVPLDGGGGGSPPPKIYLPEGETVLGRGPFLGVSDKRVSRNHGLIENVDGQLRLKPTHLNPCFCQSSLDDLPQPLQRDLWHSLHQGDIFSLLPGKHVYRVACVAGAEEGAALRHTEVEAGVPKSLLFLLKPTWSQISPPDQLRPDRTGAGLPLPGAHRTRCDRTGPGQGVPLPGAHRTRWNRTGPGRASHSLEPTDPLEPDRTGAGRPTPWSPPDPLEPDRTGAGRPTPWSPPDPLGTGQGPGQGSPLPGAHRTRWDRTGPGQGVPGHDAESCGGRGTRQPGSSNKRRVLPAWMTASAAVPQSPSSAAKGAGKTGRAKAATTPASRASALPKRAKATGSPSGEESDGSEAEQRPRKRARKRTRSSDGEEEAQSKAVKKARRPRATERVESGEDSDHMEVEEERREVSASDGNATKTASVPESQDRDGKSKHGQPDDDEAESRGSNCASSSGSAQPRAQRRTACPYGKECYRKNPLHFQECSHPGDGDYQEEDEVEEEEEEEDADRPECPYGTGCYRKNPLHRKEYKHTKRPARTTRAAPKNHDDDEDEEDVGYDDSFIDDDSEGGGDDSDYVPPDSPEDVGRLQSEAKAFLKRPR